MNAEETQKKLERWYKDDSKSKYFNNWQPAAKFRIGKSSTTKYPSSLGSGRLQLMLDDDIV